MKVKELKEALEFFHPESEIVIMETSELKDYMVIGIKQSKDDSCKFAHNAVRIVI